MIFSSREGFWLLMPRVWASPPSRISSVQSLSHVQHFATLISYMLDLPVEKAMAPHSSTLSWKIPWTEEPGGLQSMGSLRVGHNWATSLSLFTFMHGEGNGNPLQCSCLENPRDGEAWWAAVYGVAQSRTRLKQLSSSSSTFIWVASFIHSMVTICKTSVRHCTSLILC